jgi:hypothetical protein
MSMQLNRYLYFCFIILLGSSMTFVMEPTTVEAQDQGTFRIARIKYRGGGDWYNDPSSLTNMIEYLKKTVPVSLDVQYDDVSIGSPDLFNYPFAFMTGHGNITLNQAEINNVHKYLENGGFLYIDDDYGFDKYVRKILKEIFPNHQMHDLPHNHPIYHQVFNFPDGCPKIHKHDGKPAQGFGIYLHGRLVVYYTYQTNLGDGWADPEIHNDPQSIREKAFKMGVNILVYALTNAK